MWLISWKFRFAKNSCVEHIWGKNLAKWRKELTNKPIHTYTYMGIVESGTVCILYMCRAIVNNSKSLNIHISPFRIGTNLNCLRFCLYLTLSLPMSLWCFVLFLFHFLFLFRLLTLFLFCVHSVAYLYYCIQCSISLLSLDICFLSKATISRICHSFSHRFRQPYKIRASRNNNCMKS